MVKLYDLVMYYGKTFVYTVPHPLVDEFLVAVKELIALASKMTRDGLTIKWSHEIVMQVGLLVPKLENIMYRLDDLSEAHWHDDRHSHGEENILRSEQMTRRIRFLKDQDHNFKVESVIHGADIIHHACGTGLKIDDYFKDNMKKDISFYGKVWCPTCRVNASWSQYTMFRRTS